MNASIFKFIQNYVQYHLVKTRGLSPNTILSYKVTIKLLLHFIAKSKKKEIKSSFLKDLENCSNNEPKVKKLILKEVNNNNEVVEFIQKHFELSLEQTYITSTSTLFNIDRLKDNSISSIVNLKKINDVRFINKFFESINIKLPNSGLYLGCVETYPNRKKVLLQEAINHSSINE